MVPWEPWPGRGFRVVLEVGKWWKLPGEGDLSEKASGRDVLPVEIDELLSLERALTQGVAAL